MSKEIIIGDKNQNIEKLPDELQTTFYRDNPKKIFALSMLSAGIYDLLWFYRHWRHFKRRAVAIKKIDQLSLNNYKTDENIIPFWTSFFCGFYIVGTARRIRDKMKSGGFSNWETGPWWAFLLFGNDALLGFFYLTEDINLNIMVYLLEIFIVAISTWQITRLQIKANEYMNLSKECDNTCEIVYKKWDIIILLLGFMLGFLNLIGTISPN